LIDRCIAYSVMIGLASAFLWHFIYVLCYGSYLVVEPSKIILVGEIFFMIGIIIFGIDLIRRSR